MSVGDLCVMGGCVSWDLCVMGGCVSWDLCVMGGCVSWGPVCDGWVCQVGTCA